MIFYQFAPFYVDETEASENSSRIFNRIFCWCRQSRIFNVYEADFKNSITVRKIYRFSWSILLMSYGVVRILVKILVFDVWSLKKSIEIIAATITCIYPVDEIIFSLFMIVFKCRLEYQLKIVITSCVNMNEWCEKSALNIFYFNRKIILPHFLNRINQFDIYLCFHSSSEQFSGTSISRKWVIHYFTVRIT